MAPRTLQKLPLAGVLVSMADVTPAPVVARPIAVAGIDVPANAAQDSAPCAKADEVASVVIPSIAKANGADFMGPARLSAGPGPNSTARYPCGRKYSPWCRGHWRQTVRPQSDPWHRRSASFPPSRRRHHPSKDRRRRSGSDLVRSGYRRGAARARESGRHWRPACRVRKRRNRAWHASGSGNLTLLNMKFGYGFSRLWARIDGQLALIVENHHRPVRRGIGPPMRKAGDIRIARSGELRPGPAHLIRHGIAVLAGPGNGVFRRHVQIVENIGDFDRVRDPQLPAPYGRRLLEMIDIGGGFTQRGFALGHQSDICGEPIVGGDELEQPDILGLGKIPLVKRDQLFDLAI